MKKNDNRLLFLPLGGCGEIGMNLNLYGHKGYWLMVDCGMMFADSYSPGVDLVFPDPGFIESEGNRLAGMMLTHGHEDHIGAIPHLWKRFKCPLYATAFTAELIIDKLKEAGIEDEVPLTIVEPHIDIEVGPFSVRYVPLAHSIAEGHGLVIKTEVGTLFHTGDWKLDKTPLIGPVCPSDLLTDLGTDGVLALICDSTNVFNTSESGSEATVRDNLIELVSGLKGRVVITTFASNVARMDTIGAVAKATGRSLALMGRSMQRVLKAGRATGYLQDMPNLVGEEYIDDLPADKVLIACTGCQGEPRAALARIAKDDHRNVRLAAGDNVIFSSKIIPGNDLSLGQLFNQLAEKKINIITEKDEFIHVSGHPGQPELAQMYEWTKPMAVIPVHGEGRHLMRQAKFAKEKGIKHTIVPRNGDIIDISTSGLLKIDEVPVGRLVLDGNRVIDIDDMAITERRRAASNGFITVSLVFDRKDALAAEPAIAILGLPQGHDDVFYDGLLAEVETGIDRMRARDRQDDTNVEEVVRIAARRFCRKEIGKNPGVATLITRYEDMAI
ncbi:ribonuclease J [Kordiimonas pumila]|uniref:Ribonuclease J n=1 Tax=Kordiimonas pumila TaxID=2161677 RepID=A0ABV7D2A0_9PROT|nr:ribonuclease J [Kordiimonas pumila]